MAHTHPLTLPNCCESETGWHLLSISKTEKLTAFNFDQENI